MKRLMGALCLLSRLAGILCAGCGSSAGNTGVSSTRYTADTAVTRRADEAARRGRVAYDAYAESGSARDGGRGLTYATGTDGAVLPDGGYRYSALTGRILPRDDDSSGRADDGAGGEAVDRRDLMTQTLPDA